MVARINKKICWYCRASVCPPADRWICEDCEVQCCTRCFRPELALCADCFGDYMAYPPGSCNANHTVMWSAVMGQPASQGDRDKGPVVNYLAPTDGRQP